MHDIHIIIMAGGVGSRFWSMATPDCPKQFHPAQPGETFDWSANFIA